MSFQLPDLILEAVIRDGLANLTKNQKIIDDIFSSLTENYNRRKYGISELDKIKKLITTTQVNVVHSYSEITANLPCYSIQLGSDVEAKNLARIGDFNADVREDLTDPTDIADLIVLDSIVVEAYDPLSGKVSVSNGSDLDAIHPNLIFVDGSGAEFPIRAGVSNSDDTKFFFIDKKQTVNISDFCHIKSALNFTQFEVNGVTSDVQIMVGVHTKDALTTKYLYTMLKYFILSRKPDLINRNFILASYQGSDFTRNMEYQGDIVFNRFLTVTGKVEDSWKGSDVELIDNIEIQTLVDSPEASANDLNEGNFTVKPNK